VGFIRFLQTDRQTAVEFTTLTLCITLNTINGAFCPQNLFRFFINSRYNKHPPLLIEQAGWRYYLSNLRCADLEDGPRHRLPDICRGYDQLLQVPVVRPWTCPSTPFSNSVLIIFLKSHNFYIFYLMIPSVSRATDDCEQGTLVKW